MMAVGIHHVTRKPWAGNLQHDEYGASDTYFLAAGWLQGCADVADWGASRGAFAKYLPATVRYISIDGTKQTGTGIVADLMTYHQPSDGILIRHVLEHVERWNVVLRNALAAFQRRMMVITYTPDAKDTAVVKTKSGWPVRWFNSDDLVCLMGAHLVHHERVKTSHPEHVYYLEKRP